MKLPVYKPEGNKLVLIFWLKNELFHVSRKLFYVARKLFFSQLSSELIPVKEVLAVTRLVLI